MVLGSFHVGAKLNRRLLQRWARLLRELPHARLLMVGPDRDSDLGRRFEAMGVPATRVELRGRVSLADHFALLRHVDVMLDCDPCSGHTVACHALWMGVPVVTLAGRRHHQRMVGSVLAATGLSHHITTSEQAYVDRVAALAAASADGAGRSAAHREALRSRFHASPACDAPRFTRHFESLLLAELAADPSPPSPATGNC